MRLTKFPVTSPSGAEYRVVIAPETEYHPYGMSWDGYACRVYTKRTTPILRWLAPWRCVSYVWEYESIVEASSFVAWAKSVVKQCDAEAAAVREIDEKRRQFLEWDGDIRELP